MPEDPALVIPLPPADARAKVLPRRLPLAGSSPPDLVPARMINEALYCERLLYLEWVQGEFTDNAFTVEGRVAHKRADQPGGKLPPPPTDPISLADAIAIEVETSPEPPAPPYQARTLWLSSERLGITAKIDVVEGDAEGRVVPIEYKRGKAVNGHQELIHLGHEELTHPRRSGVGHAHVVGGCLSSLGSERLDGAGPRSPGPRVTSTSAC